MIITNHEVCNYGQLAFVADHLLAEQIVKLAGLS